MGHKGLGYDDKEGDRRALNNFTKILQFSKCDYIKNNKVIHKL